MVTTYFMNCIMGNVFKTKTSPALPANFYLGLSTTTPTIDGSGHTEPSAGSGYARVKLANLSAPSDGVICNSGEISFAKSTSDWGKITHFLLFDAATGGNLLLFEQITKPHTVEESTTVIIETDSLKFTLANVA